MPTRILIVDDEPGIRGLLCTAFRSAGYEAATASGGSEAIALCRQTRFDVVLSDVLMPDMNGHDLARWIAEQIPGTRTLLMSGFDAGCQGCPFAGRCVLLAKPFRPSEAIAAVEKALGSAPPEARASVS